MNLSWSKRLLGMTCTLFLIGCTSNLGIVNTNKKVKLDKNEIAMGRSCYIDWWWTHKKSHKNELHKNMAIKKALISYVYNHKSNHLNSKKRAYKFSKTIEENNAIKDMKLVNASVKKTRYPLWILTHMLTPANYSCIKVKGSVISHKESVANL
ncbi:hypothetical protein [Helicobacter cetorum]|uniref:hypothetical protein n=1 Tax=Helicobacter cetorum TaxID=138563 RepID=UPI0012DE83A5|nr:hypothetical protein [Helicobacter cetorum]